MTETVTLSPTSSLGYSTVYTATLGGAQDLAGNVMAPFSWSFTTAADTTPPVVTSTSPAANATGVVIDSVVTATFSEAVQASTISFVLKDASNNTVPATVSYDASSHTATLTPNSALTAMASYTATLSGAEDLAGNALTAPISWSFTTGATIWNNAATPAVASSTDSNAIEVGGEVPQ